MGESVGEKRDVKYQTFKKETEDITIVLPVLVEGFSDLNSSIRVIKNFWMHSSYLLYNFIFKYFFLFFWFVSIRSFLSVHFCCIIIQLMHREWENRWTTTLPWWMPYEWWQHLHFRSLLEKLQSQRYERPIDVYFFHITICYMVAHLDFLMHTHFYVLVVFYVINFFISGVYFLIISSFIACFYYIDHMNSK